MEPLNMGEYIHVSFRVFYCFYFEAHDRDTLIFGTLIFNFYSDCVLSHLICHCRYAAPTTSARPLPCLVSEITSYILLFSVQPAAEFYVWYGVT